MMKQAWRSYIASLHPRNVKKLRESEAYLWTYIILLPLYAGIALLEENSFADMMCLAFLRILFPLGLMGWSNLGSKYLMPKAMFLCPMKERERREYVNCVLVIKIGIMMLSSFLVELIWSFFFGFRLWEVLLMPFLYFLYGIAEYAGFEVKRDERGQLPSTIKDKNGNKIPVWINSMAMVCVIMAITCFTVFDIDAQKYGIEYAMDSSGVMFIFFGVAIGFALLFDFFILKGQYKYVIERSSDYELHFHIKGKVEKLKKYDLFAK